MLRFLRITRLAVIDAAEVEFAPGLNVLTGETGAGKSILVGAVGLLLGDRASGDLVRTGEDLATVEAIFETADGEELVVRREITAQGRSRAFINGSLATAGALKELAAGLIELHGQHEHQVLLDPATHLQMLDAYGRLEHLAVPVAASFEKMRGATEALASARKTAAERDTRLDAIRFQLAELDKANPTAGEDETLLATRQVLANADRVQRLCGESYAALYERDGSIVEEMEAVWKKVADLAAIDPEFAPYLEQRSSIRAQLEDLALLLRRYGDRIDTSPARLQQTEERLALLERLKRKYGPLLSDVITRRKALKEELDELDQAEETVTALEKAQAESRASYLTVARALSAARHEVATRFARALEAEMSGLAMDQTRFDVRFNQEPLPDDRWTANGIDEAEFFLSPNPGEDLRALARIASGGELSRIMLGIKTLAAGARPVAPTAGAHGLVFDEVDAGIGGRIADVVGQKLSDLARRFQVLCITHLPQIAAYATTHFHITKTVEQGRTRTTVARLDPEARVEEIGRMLGGALITDGVRASARELLARAAEQSASAKPRAKGERAKAKVSRTQDPGERRDTR